MKHSLKLKAVVAIFSLLAFCPAFSKGVSVSTNVLDYASGGTINLSASWGLVRHFSLEASGKYNPFSFGEGSSEWYYKQRSAAVGARWWPWCIYSGWWLGAKARWQEYATVPRGGVESTEGDRYGAVFSAGYSWMLGRHFNLDLGFGGWLGYEKGTVYACQHCGRNIRNSDGFFMLPSEFLLSFVYVF